ncbi:hypothetical protein BDW71DRAFT_206486 [Aspergillus fruticulosus]
MQLPLIPYLSLLALTLSSTMTLTSANPLEVNNPPIPQAFVQKPTPNAKHPSIQTPSRSNPTLSPSQASASQSLVNSIATLLASSAASSLDPTTCPPTHSSRQCCTSVDSLADEVVGGNAIGGILPWFQDVQPGTQSLFKSGCIPYDKAIQDKKEAIEKSKAETSNLAAQFSSVPAPTASP